MQKVFREVKTEIHFKTTENLDFPPHLHEDIELIFVLEGSSTAWCNGQNYSLEKNSFFITFPNQVHHYEHSKDGKFLLIILKPSVLFGYSDIFFSGIPLFNKCLLSKQETECLSKLLFMALNDYSREGFSSVIQGYLTAFFGKLLRHYPLDNVQTSKNTFLKILKYCSDNFTHDVTLSEISAELCISKSSISHLFSSQLNMNFCSYINLLRLQLAEQLLADGNYSITEVASLSGFSTIRTFNRAFVKKHAITPCKYRKMLQK